METDIFKQDDKYQVIMSKDSQAFYVGKPFITYDEAEIYENNLIKFLSSPNPEFESQSRWKDFKVVKKFTFFPLRIYQYTSQTTWWSWMKTSYILKGKNYPSAASNFFNWLYSYFIGYYWKTERMSDINEYNNYLTYINKKA